MNMQDTFPPEILEIVVEFSSANKTTLQALSLVSTSCLALARKHLFAYITFRPPNSNAYIGGSSARSDARSTIPPEPLLGHGSPCSTLLAIIEASKRRRCRLGTFAPFVRHLHIQEGTGILSRWIAADSSLPPVLRALSNLVSFRLTGLGPMPFFWAHIPVGFRNAITRDVLSQSTLVEVRLCGIVFEDSNQVNSLLGPCRGLKTLYLCHSGVQQEGVETDEDVEGFTLDTLTLGPFAPTLFIRSMLRPSCPIRVNTVRKLCLTVAGNLSDFTRIILASKTLETLELVLGNPFDVNICPSEQLDLSKSPSLCDFRIKFNMFQDADILLKWLAAILRTGIDPHFPTCPNMMKNLTVIFPLSCLIDTAQFSGWRTVDAVLCGDGHRNGETQSHAYSNLKRVNLEFVLKKPADSELGTGFLDALDSPGLKERGLLTINAVDM